MLLTFGLMLVLQDAVRLVFGSMGVPFSTPHSLTGMVNLGFMYLSQLSTFSNRGDVLGGLCSMAVSCQNQAGLYHSSGDRQP